MNLTITLSFNHSDSQTVDKRLTDEKNGTATTKDDTNYTAPVLTLSRDLLDKKYNYIYILQYGRYYYITDIVYLSGNLARVQCSVDVLMSFKQEIRQITCTVSRNENLRNGYLLDNKYQTLAYEQIVTKKFPNAMNQDSVILMTMG